MHSSRRSVVVTGVGPVCGFGVGAEALWNGLASGGTAIAPIARFDAHAFPCPLAASVPADALDVLKLVPKSYRKATKVMARDIEIAVAAAHAAVADAGLTTRGTAEGQPPTIPAGRVGCHIGAGLIAADTDELSGALVTCRRPDGTFDIGAWGQAGMQNLTPLWLLKYLPNMLACHVTIIHGCEGPSNTITCAEASSGLSLGESRRVIERGAADACLSGGAESKINPMGMLRQHFAGRTVTPGAGEDALGLLKPFSTSSCGTVLGEGGGLLVLEELECARRRGGRILAEFAGFAAGQCGADTLGQDLSGAGDDVAAVINGALNDAGMKPGEISAIVPLGSGTSTSDAAEVAGLRQVFGARLSNIPLVTIIPAVGNCAAGAGALAATTAVLCLDRQMLPARRAGGDLPGVDASPCAARSMPLSSVLVVTTSLGGQITAVVFRRAA